MATSDKDNITLRKDKNSPMTREELDTNFSELKFVIDDLYSNEDRLDNVGEENVTSSTGTQTVAEALDSRVNKGEIGGEEVETSTGTQTVAGALDQRVIYEEAGLTVLIPGDYPTLQEAIDDLSNIKVGQGEIIDLVIEAGHEPASGVSVSNGDYGHFRISSEDAEVSVSGDFSIKGDNARMPILNCLIDLENSTSFDSYLSSNGSVGFIESEAGMFNGERGIHATNGSSVVADGCIFTGFQQAGCHASRSSVVQCSDANFSDCSKGGGPFGAVYASRNSLIHGQYVDVTNSGSSALRAQRLGRIAFPECDVSGAQGAAIIATLSGEVYGTSKAITANDLQAEAIVCQEGSKVNVSGVFNCSNSFSGVAIECRGGHISAPEEVTGYSGLVINCLEGGVVNARNIKITSGSTAIRSEQGGRVNARGCDISGMTSNGVFADRGGFIEVCDGNITGSGSNDIACDKGSWVAANNCTTTNGTGSPSAGDTNFSSLDFSDNGRKGFIWT